MKFGESFTWSRPLSPEAVTISETPGTLRWTLYNPDANAIQWDEYQPMVEAPDAYQWLVKGFSMESFAFSAAVSATVTLPSDPPSAVADAERARERLEGLEQQRVEDCARLVSQFGFLTWSTTQFYTELLDYELTDRKYHEEGIGEWLDAQHQMGHALALMKALGSRDSAAADFRVYIITGEHDPRPLARARDLLLGVVNDNLHGHVSPVIGWGAEGLEVDLWPVDLLGAMWLQLVRSMIGDLKIEKCANPRCTNMVVLTKDDIAHNKMYCSPKCKVAAHRAKKKAAEGGETHG